MLGNCKLYLNTLLFMKESFKIVKTKYNKIAPLVGQGNLKDYQFVQKRVLIFKLFLIDINTLYQDQPISVSTWNKSLLKECVLPILSEFFFLQEVIYFYHAYDREPNPIRNINKYLLEIDHLISTNLEGYSDCLLYQQNKVPLSYILSQYQDYKRKDNAVHFTHELPNIPTGIRIIAVSKAILLLNKYHNRLQPVLNQSCWQGSKQQLSAVVSFLFTSNLIDNKKANQQDIARQFAFTFNLTPFNTYRLFYNYKHSSDSNIDFTPIYPLNAVKNQSNI